jgi:hypothetical protein
MASCLRPFARQEFTERLSVFQRNVAFIQETHARNPHVQLALNEFADETWEEFSSRRLGLKVSEERLRQL